MGQIGGLRAARSEIRRQLREERRVRLTAMATVVVLLLGAPLIYLGIETAARDPVLNSLAGLPVPDWAAESSEDRIISGSRWCFIDCRFRERRLVSQGEPEETYQVYVQALRDVGWSRWDVEGCPLVEVDGDYTCWTRDEYTLDLWVHPPPCAYDPRRLRPDVPADSEEEVPDIPNEEKDCSGSIVEIKMQNRVADERGISGVGPSVGPSPPAGTPSGDPSEPASSPDTSPSPAP